MPTPAPRPQISLDSMGFMPYDVQYLLILDKYGKWIDTLLWQRTDDGKWTQYQFDVIAFAGRTIGLHFGVYNDGLDGVTAMYVDEVSLSVCAPSLCGSSPP